MPLISIGITCFNAELAIERAIQSALDQTWVNKELVIVDDCSTDSSIAIIEKFVERFERVRFYQNKKNVGVAASRNNIIKYADGDYIAFFDDDDVSDINRIEFQYHRIEDYKNKWKVNKPIICHTSRLVVYTDGTSATEETIGCNLNNISPNGEDVASRILLGSPLEDGLGSIATCSQMGSKKTYLSVGGFDESFRRQEDTELNIRLALSGCHFVGIEEPLVTQFLTESDDKSIDIEETSTLNIIKKHRDYIEIRSNYTFVVSWIKIKFMFYKKDYFLFSFNLIILLIKHPIYSSKRFILTLPSLMKNQKYFSDNR
jgi:glycosyltransferase involved in cell wall biosynthesis